MNTTPTLLPRRLFLWLAVFAAAGLATSCRTPMRTDRPTLTWSLTGTVWKLVELNGEAVGSSKLPSLLLDPATGRVSGMAGVNRYSGTFQQQDAAVSFGPLAVTKMAGPEKDMKVEADFLATLPHVTAWKADGLMLSLLAGDKEVARFQGLPAGAPLD